VVPDVLGETLPDAIDIVQAAGLNVVDDGVPEGDPTGEAARVRAQEPGGRRSRATRHLCRLSDGTLIHTELLGVHVAPSGRLAGSRSGLAGSHAKPR
jgi:hypothetical protein